MVIRVKELRERAGISQQKLAEISGLSIRVIARLESEDHNNPRLSTLTAIAKALSIPLADLLVKNGSTRKRTS